MLWSVGCATQRPSKKGRLPTVSGEVGKYVDQWNRYEEVKRDTSALVILLQTREEQASKLLCQHRHEGSTMQACAAAAALVYLARLLKSVVSGCMTNEYSSLMPMAMAMSGYVCMTVLAAAFISSNARRSLGFSSP